MNRSARFALGGLEAGVSGALAMLAWLAFASILYRRTMWWIPNLLASIFGDSPRFLSSFTKYTAAGLALHIFVYGALGCLFGLMWRDQRGGARLLWAGIAVGHAAWYLVFRVLWKGMSPVAQLYTPDRQILIGNIVYGFMLTRFPKCAAKVN